MDDARVANARAARSAHDAIYRTMIVTGDASSLDYWTHAFEADGEHKRNGRATVVAEQGRKGNFLGALQAYERAASQEFSPLGVTAFDQLVMLVGSGTRLSPITQSLGNMKAALVLPSNDGDRSTLTVGEAAIRSSAPWVQALRDSGFDGLVMRWGDEIIIPSSVLSADPAKFEGADVVRFGYTARPNEVLATQKEWLLCDEDGAVYAELPRQPLRRLLDRVSNFRSAKTLHVNLGSFAASHDFMSSLVDAFRDLLSHDSIAANWDPYLWIALHSSNQDEWEEACRAGKSQVPREFAALVSAIPDFWQRSQRAKRRLRELTGREFTAKVMDFGDPYWFDAGNHLSLRSGISAIFEPTLDGDTVRELLGLPSGLATGENFICNSDLAEESNFRNSVVIGSVVGVDASFAERSVIINSRLGYLRADPGAIVIECKCESLLVDGPEGFAFRLEGRAHVAGNEVTARVSLPKAGVRLSYFDISKIVDDDSFENRRWANPISFREAAALVNLMDVY